MYGVSFAEEKSAIVFATIKNTKKFTGVANMSGFFLPFVSAIKGKLLHFRSHMLYNEINEWMI